MIKPGSFTIENNVCSIRLRGVELFEDEGSESQEGAACGSEKRFAPPEVIEMFMVNGNTQDFFKPLGHT